MPVTRNFYVSHQWLREMKRWGRGVMLGVYFRLPDEEPIEMGHYNTPHVSMTAAEAVAVILDAERRNPRSARHRDRDSTAVREGAQLPASPEGYEVFIPRRIARSEIIRVKPLPQVVGWRYHPGANGTPAWTCLCCGGRGQYGVRKLLRRVELAEATGKPTKVAVFGRGDDSYRRVERLRKARQRATSQRPRCETGQARDSRPIPRP